MNYTASHVRRKHSRERVSCTSFIPECIAEPLNLCFEVFTIMSLRTFC